MEKLLTISIAAYNVEQYLEQTMDSLCKSKYLEDLEIIIVNDGSRDNTKCIAEKYQARFPKSVIFVDKENGGHGSTINKSLSLAKGKYYKVIDGDDWVNTEVFDKFIERLREANEDIILNDYYTVSPVEKVKVEPFKKLTAMFSYEINNIPDLGIVTLHSLTVKTEKLRATGVRLTEKCFYVDIEYIVYSIIGSTTLLYINLPLYYYRIGNINQSVNKKNMIKNIDMQVKVCKSLMKIYKAKCVGNQISNSKRKMIYNRIKKSVGSAVRTYLLFGTLEETRRNIVRFETDIKSLCEEFYNSLKEDRFFAAIRFGNYLLLPEIKIAYKVYCKKKYDF